MIEIPSDDFIPYVQARCPTVNELDTELAVREAVIAFMKDSLLFRSMTEITGQQCISEYVLDIPKNQVIIDIINDGVKKKGRIIDDWHRDGGYDAIEIPNLRDGDCISVEYYYHISRDNCGIPYMVFDKYLNTIVDRALMFLFTGDNTGGVSPSLFNVASAAYAQTIADIKARLMHNMSRKIVRMRLPTQRTWR